PSPVVSCLQIPNATPFSSLCKHTAPTELYTLSLHDALPICPLPARPTISVTTANCTTYTFTLNDVSGEGFTYTAQLQEDDDLDGDRKSTRLNSSHVKISYAVFCLKKKKVKQKRPKILELNLQ